MHSRSREKFSLTGSPYVRVEMGGYGAREAAAPPKAVVLLLGLELPNPFASLVCGLLSQGLSFPICTAKRLHHELRSSLT